MRIFCPAITRPSLLVSRLVSSRLGETVRPAPIPPTPAVGRVALVLTRRASPAWWPSCSRDVLAGGRAERDLQVRHGHATTTPPSAEGQEILFSSQCPRPGNPAGATGISWQRSCASPNRRPGALPSVAPRT